MLPFSLLLMFMYSFSFCSVEQKKSSQIESKYSINLDEKKEVSISYSTYFKNATPIILETNKDCLIGNITELKIFDGYVYILDAQSAKSLFVFDLDGRFIRKIGSLGNGPGEYTQLSNFTLDMENRFIYLLDYFKHLHKYHLDGTFVKTITPKVQNNNIIHIQYYNKRLYMRTIGYKPTASDCMLMEADPDNGDILSKSLPLKYNKGWAELIFMGNSFFMPKLNDPPLFTQMFMDHIVSIGEYITPYIEIKSKNLVTDKDISNITEVSGGRDIFQRFNTYLRENSKIFNINNYVENDEFIFFMYQQGLMNINVVIVNKKTESVVLTQNFINDLIFKNDENHYFDGFKFSDTKGAYEILQTRSIVNFLESIRNSEIVPELNKYDKLLNLEDDANPVIFYYEYK